MTSKLVVNTIEADTGISSVSFGSSISLSSTSKFFFGAAGIDIGADTNINRPAAGVLGFNINSSERFRIDSSGRVMVGTTAASTLTSSDDLTISTSGSTGITLFSATGNAGNIAFGDGTSGDDRQRGLLQYHHSDNTMRFFTNAARRMTIDSSGRVLIGTTNEGEANADDLTIATTGHTGITLRSGTSNYGQIFFSDAESGTGEYEGIIAYDHSNNSMVFHTTRVERVRITSSGEMGVNTTAPVEKLGISGNMRFVNPNGNTSRITALPSGTYSTGTSGGSAICFQRTADGGGGSDEIFFETHWQGNRHGESCRINKYGNLKFPSGQGIDFSATSDASGKTSELLDDYEEGSWTPTVESGSGSFYVYSATYTKIGRQVGIQFYMQLNNGGGNGNGVSIGGLPFAVRSNGWTCAKVSTGYNNSGVHCRAKAGTSAIDIKGPADQTVTFSNINGTWILSSFVYFTDS